MFHEAASRGRMPLNLPTKGMSILKSRSLVLVILLLSWAAISTRAQVQESPNTIVIDAAAPAHPFPHFWEQMFGSGRAILSLRESYHQDLRAVQQITDFKYVRFHAILHDEVGVYDEDSEGKPIYNFSYVDQIYDGLLSEGVKPFVELSFMPNKLAASPHFQAFWYKPDVSPPKDWAKWDDLIAAFLQHLIARYGIDEVATWYFEVWNEPNLDFWAGEPRQSTYFELYDHTAGAIKKVNPRLRVGGPATAQAAWADVFIQHCAQNNVPVDFVSSHVYANDTSNDVFHTTEAIARDQMVCRAVRHVHEQIVASAKPALPLIWSEFNASYKNEPEVTDSTYMGPWLAETIQQCDGQVDLMSYWTFSDVFEEQGVVKTPFYGGFGLLAEDSIPKPAFYAFKLLHQLGDQRLTLNSDSALVTRSKNGSLEIAVWNYDAPTFDSSNADSRNHNSPNDGLQNPVGPAKDVVLRFQNISVRNAVIWRVDSDHGDFHKAYMAMHEPKHPTQAEIVQLRAATQIAPETRKVKDGRLELQIPPSGLVLVEVK
jgi:xylan 1,4-beta-xylosidase